MNNSLYKQILSHLAERGYSKEYQNQMMSVAPVEINSHLRALQQSLHEADYKAFASHIHGLKGSFGALGLHYYHDISVKMHLAAKLILDSEMFDIQHTESGILFTEQSGSNRLLIPGPAAEPFTSELIRSRLAVYLETSFTDLCTPELREFSSFEGEIPA